MKYILLLPLLFAITSLKAQAPVKEYGIGLANFDQFSLQYRWGDGTKFYRIIGSVRASFASDDKTIMSGSGNPGNTFQQTSPYSIGVGMGFSVFKLKPINEKIGLMYGINYSVSYAADKYEVIYDPPSTGENSTHSSTAIAPAIGAVLGGYFKFSDSFFLYAEIIPNVYYQYSINTNNTINPGVSDSTVENTTSTFGISSLSNSGATLTLVYRISTIAK